MKKFLSIFLVILMLLGTFTSCSKPTSQQSQTSTDQSIGNQIIQSENNGNANESENKVESDNNKDNEENNENEEEEPSCDHEGGEDATCVTESICDICNEPYGGVDTGNHEGEEEWVATESGHFRAYSCCNKVTEEEVAHTFVDGICSVCKFECEHLENDGHSCTACKKFISHDYLNGKCTVCGLICNGKTITFGYYPQSKVTSSSIISTLNAKAGVPTTNAQAWTSYGYTENENMWFIDVEEGGEKYRGVYFSQYRPIDKSNSATATNSQQDENGYVLNTVYWFKYDPITWTVLEENTSSKKALVICDMIVDAQLYDETKDNNYVESTIRKWLNETFINTAFNELQKGAISVTEVDNSTKEAADYSGNHPFLSDNTNDKIFLLSKSDVKNTSYGYTWVKNETTNDTRTKKVTEYAKSQGVYADANNGGWWWLRTPSYNSADPTKNDLAHNVKVVGTIHSSNVYLTTGGVVPAMWIYV